MKQIVAYQFRLYPNEEQEVLINKTFGCTRLIYNIMLAKKKENNKLSRFDLNKEIPELYYKYAFLKEVDSCALRSAIADLCNGIDKYYKKQGGYAKFKKKGCKESYRTNNIRSTYKNNSYESIKIDLNKRIIVLPKLKEIKIRGYRNLEKLNGRIINATIRKDGRKYYVSVVVEEEKKMLEYLERNSIGIDIGIKSLVVTSEGISYGNPKYQDKYDKKIKGLQKSLARKVKGSNNYKKTKEKLAEVYRKLRNARKKIVEDIVSKVTKYNDIIITEKLKVKEMLEKKDNLKQNKRLRKSITNATFGLILRKLKEKCHMLNKTFMQVDTYC